jgi:hypothetical protein
METATHFPFSDKKQRDPVTGIEEGLLENVRAAEHQPKIFYTYSDTEYWERSVALTHTTPDGSKDIVPPSNIRLYHFASSSHNIGRFPPAVTNGETQDNGCATARLRHPVVTHACRMARWSAPPTWRFRIFKA